MAINLRTIISNDLNVLVDGSILTDPSISSQWTRAKQYWFKYMTRPQDAIGIDTGVALTHTFTNPIPYSIVTLYELPDGRQVSCGDYYYSKPILTVSTAGKYSVLYRKDLDLTTMTEEDLPVKLRDLFVNYSKKAVGQFLKFSSYAEKPFDIDAQGWFDEANAKISELEDFIMINRDERFENISYLARSTWNG